MLESVKGSLVSRGGATFVCSVNSLAAIHHRYIDCDKTHETTTRGGRLLCSAVLSKESAQSDFHILFIFRSVQSNNICTAQHCVTHT